MKIAKNNADFTTRVTAIVDGREKVKVWRYGMSMMCTMQNANDLDWQEIIRTAQKKIIAEKYPLIESWASERDDLTSGLWCANDALSLPGAKASKERYETMGGDYLPEYALVPLRSLIELSADKYRALQDEKIKSDGIKKKLMLIAQETGKKQRLNTYISNECLDHLEDCSFDNVTEWIDQDGKITQTHTHCH